MKNYKTSDFDKALLLLSSGCFLKDINWDQKINEATFVFEDNEKCKERLKKHRRGNLELNSKSVLWAKRELKKELYQ